MNKKLLFSEKIIKNIELNKEEYVNQWNNPTGTNTKHFIVDNLLDEQECSKIYDSFDLNNKIWIHHSTFRERKKTTAKIDTLDEKVTAIVDAFQVDEVVKCISDITQIKDLEPDRSLYAGGISAMSKGDFLNPHIDNSHDSGRSKYRRLNLLFYITPRWATQNGGNFELWDVNVKNPKVITSAFNRLIVMETGPNTYHSVNPVIVNDTRCCVSNYYFSKSSFNKSNYYHVTSFTGRPGQNLQRIYGKVDNFFRNFISDKIKIKRKDHSNILR